MNRLKSFLLNYKFEITIFLLALIFSTWLMFSSFSYKDNSMLISSKAWSDFASHIPLIRSFSFGSNFPPEYPLFSGPPIKYHFLFYAVAGSLEKMGLRIDYALNIPSIIGFAFLILMIYLFAKEIFKSKAVGILSVFLFLFNGTLSFINFFTKHPLSLKSLSLIVSSNSFASFGPYDQSIVSAFWNLNIYTNQRHLAISYALSLFIIYSFLKFKKETHEKNLEYVLFLGIILGLSFILNIAVFLMTVLILSCMLLFIDKKRVYIIACLSLAAIIAIPQYLYIETGQSTFKIGLHLGYLVDKLTFTSFINYWFQNLGIHLLLIPLGFIFAKKLPKKIFVSFFSLFLVGNLIQFSPEIAANHKFFNYFMIIGGMFSAYFLITIWKKSHYAKPAVIIMILFLTLSGILDFFPILNDSKISIVDYPKNKDIAWIIKNTNPNINFLNTQYLYDDASLAGRKIFLGWPYFAWSQGYDTLARDNLRKSLLNTNDLSYFCINTKNNNLGYAEINIQNQDAVVNTDFFNKHFPKIYQNKTTGIFIYNIKSVCS